jgi:hypothetical protein
MIGIWFIPYILTYDYRIRFESEASDLGFSPNTP